MGVFDLLSQYGYGQLHLKRDAGTGMNAIIAVHDTRLGPSLGGCRFIHYDDEEAAIVDALRLARGMTYKAAITGLSLGGGKSVIIKPRRTSTAAHCSAPSGPSWTSWPGTTSPRRTAARASRTWR